MDMYEALVETYLTVIEGCAVIPQVPILRNRKGELWSAYPDFLALNFKKPEALLIEVTKSRDLGQIKDKMRRRAGERDDIESYVKESILGTQIGFPIRWRFFLRKDKVQNAEDFLRGLGFAAEITPLESVFDKLRDVMP